MASRGGLIHTLLNSHDSESNQPGRSTHIVCFFQALVSHWIRLVSRWIRLASTNQEEAHRSCVSFKRLWAVGSGLSSETLDGPVCTRSASSFCRSTLNSFSKFNWCSPLKKIPVERATTKTKIKKYSNFIIGCQWKITPHPVHRKGKFRLAPD